MHDSKHRLTDDQWALLEQWSVIFSKTKPCQFSSVQLRRSVRALTILL